MAKKIRSKKHRGVYFTESIVQKHNGKPDRIYWITWRDAKKQWLRIGTASEGITEEYAYRRRNDIINKLNLGENPDLLIRKKAVTVDAIVDAYMEWRRTEDKHTVQDQCRYDLHIKPSIGSVAVSAITPEKLDSLKKELAGKMAGSTVKKAFAFMRAAVNLAIRRKRYSGINPFSAQGDFTMPNG